MAVGSGPSKLLVGGFRSADPSFEQYWVRPGGATVIAIAPDDRFTVIDVDGGQVAELTVLSPDGTDAAGAIGVLVLPGGEFACGHGLAFLGWSLKKRTTSAEASGPSGSV